LSTHPPDIIWETGSSVPWRQQYYVASEGANRPTKQQKRKSVIFKMSYPSYTDHPPEGRRNLLFEQEKDHHAAVE